MRYKKTNIDKKIQRALAIEAGYYDGRFRTKVVPDKKKELSRKACRNFEM